MQTRYEPTTINDLQKCLDGCSDKMRVEVKDGISLDVKTVAGFASSLYGRPAWPWSSPTSATAARASWWLSGSPDAPAATRLNLLLASLVWELTSGLRIVCA